MCTSISNEKKINSSRSFIDSKNLFSPKMPKPIIYNDKIRYITLNPINKKLTLKEKDENFSELGIVDEYGVNYFLGI